MGTSVQYTGRQDLSGGWCLREDALNGSRQRAPVARGPDAPKPELGEAIFAEGGRAGAEPGRGGGAGTTPSRRIRGRRQRSVGADKVSTNFHAPMRDWTDFDRSVQRALIVRRGEESRTVARVG